MQSPESFIVTPKYKKYKQGMVCGDVEFDTVASIENAKDVSKEAIVVSVPLNYKGDIKKGDEVIVHHNIFRDYYDQYGKMKHSRAYLYDDLYTAIPEEVFLFKRNNEWVPNLDFCFVEPIEEDTISVLSGSVLPHTGRIWLSNVHPKSELIGFAPESEYEVWINEKLYYRMRDRDICVYDRFNV